jgi:hypothetical protein
MTYYLDSTRSLYVPLPAAIGQRVYVGGPDSLRLTAAHRSTERVRNET